MSNPEDNPVKAALENAKWRADRSRRRAVILSVVALASGGELINHEIGNGWSQDSRSEVDESVFAFTGGMVIGMLMAHKDNRRVYKYRKDMYERSKQE
jgi:hypothetical protein